MYGKILLTHNHSSDLTCLNRSSSGNLVTEHILEAGPLLEALGNARTARCDNSSRFGKYQELFYRVSKFIRNFKAKCS